MNGENGGSRASAYASPSGRVGTVVSTSSRGDSSFHDFVSTSLCLEPEDINACTHLRVFDSLRRALGGRLAGSEGLAVGYDSLSLRPVPAVCQSGKVRVIFTAIVCRVESRRHLVEYLATIRPGSPLESSCIELAKGRAWTLHGSERCSSADSARAQE